MIRYTVGNLLESTAQALVNTVNTVGVMGKGIALQFKETYPHNYRVYRKACKDGQLQPGQLLVVRDQTAFGEKLIVNFPTKTHWRKPSEYSYVEEGLKALTIAIEEQNIQSIAIPPLGCGNGGLDWPKVKQLIEQYLADSSAEIIVYEPNPQIKQQLQESNSPKEVKLTPARAMLMYALFQYELRGETPSLFVANKLAYFLQRLGEPLRLNFQKHFYGPYTPQIKNVLYYLNGAYLSGLEQQNAKPFEALRLNYDRFQEVEQYLHQKLNPEQRTHLDNLLLLISGFESTYALEILATVDYIMQQTPNLSKEEIVQQAQEWSSRKKKLLKPAFVEIALKQLQTYQDTALA
jgi:O-acetyl-ADP-ribose deacetylase (regulator of RNase III)